MRSAAHRPIISGVGAPQSTAPGALFDRPGAFVTPGRRARPLKVIHYTAGGNRECAHSMSAGPPRAVITYCTASDARGRFCWLVLVTAFFVGFQNNFNSGRAAMVCPRMTHTCGNIRFTSPFAVVIEAEMY